MNAHISDMMNEVFTDSGDKLVGNTTATTGVAGDFSYHTLADLHAVVEKLTDDVAEPFRKWMLEKGFDLDRGGWILTGSVEFANSVPYKHRDSVAFSRNYHGNVYLMRGKDIPKPSQTLRYTRPV